ncbi:G2/M phase-specific E3 ubiquitin-protein ligase-like [Dysidea avara]
MQVSLDLTPAQEIVDQVASVKEECLNCGEKIVISQLREHLQVCGSRFAESSDEDDHDLTCTTMFVDTELEMTHSANITDRDSNSEEEDSVVLPPCNVLTRQLQQSEPTVPSIDLTHEDVPSAADIGDETSINGAEPTLLASSLIAPPTAGDETSTNSTEAIVNTLLGELNDEFTINVRRSNLLQDALKEARKKKFDVNKRMKVTFVGESGVDLGGPKREFFRLFIKELSQSGFMLGGKNKFFSSNVQAIQKKDFMRIGWYAGISVVQGGPGFPLLSDSVYQYLCTGETTNIEIDDEDLPLMIKALIQQIKAATSNNEVQAVFDGEQYLNQSALMETGYMKPFEALTTDDKDEIISILIDYHCLIKPKAAMDQFAEGLQCTGVLHYMKHHDGCVLRDLFRFRPSVLTAESLKELFSVTYSGDDQRSVEEQAYVFFGDFLDDCEAGDIECTLEHVLVFCTGADSVPVGGFGKKIELIFLGDDKILPTSSTCFLTLRMPTCHRTNKDFNDNMILGFRCSNFFGYV